MKFTLLHPFFNHNFTLTKQLEFWSRWTPSQKKNVEIIIIDDCSPEPIDLNLLKPYTDLNFSVYKIIDDIPWNAPGVKNLGFTLAKTDWVIAADMDISCTTETLVGLWNLDYTDSRFQYWPRLYYPSKNRPERERWPHCNSFVMSKEVFWELGGYDEDFAGNWGWEDIWFHKVWCETLNPDKVIYKELSNVGFRWLRGYVHSSKFDRTGVYEDKQAKNMILLERKIADKTRSKEVLRFKWEKIY